MKIRCVLAICIVGACAQPPDPALPGAPAAAVTRNGVEYSAETLVMESFPVQLRTNVAIRAPDAPQTLELPGGCPVQLAVYRDEGRTRLVWDQQRVAVCTMQLLQLRVTSRAQVVAGGASAGVILGDSLPDGRYWLEAVLRPNNEVVRVPAGFADLAVPRDDARE